MRLIDADVLTDDVIGFYLGAGFHDCLPGIREMVTDQPTIEAEPVVHAHWETEPSILLTHSDGHTSYRKEKKFCSRCKRRNRNSTPPFCPFCGAKMDEEVADYE